MYADAYRKIDVADMVSTAKTMGFKEKYRLVYDAFVLLAEDLNGEYVHFEDFLVGVTERIVSLGNILGTQ